MSFRIVSEPRADLDVGAAFDWYEREQHGLGFEFLEELRATYDRIAEGPFKYQVMRSGIRRSRTPCTSRWRAMSSSWSPCSMRAVIQPSGSDGAADVRS